MRLDPVEVAVLAAILDVTDPRTARLEAAPRVLEGLLRHVGMAHDVMRMAEQFALAEAADLDEVAIGIGDHALEIGLGDDALRLADLALRAGHRQVDLHECSGACHARLLFVRASKHFPLAMGRQPDA